MTLYLSAPHKISNPHPSRVGLAFLVLVYGDQPKGSVKSIMQNTLNLKRVEPRLWLEDNRHRLDLYVTEARIWPLIAWFLWAVYLMVI